jgi:hypothetical protein
MSPAANSGKAQPVAAFDTALVSWAGWHNLGSACHLPCAGPRRQPAAVAAPFSRHRGRRSLAQWKQQACRRPTTPAPICTEVGRSLRIGWELPRAHLLILRTAVDFLPHLLGEDLLRVRSLRLLNHLRFQVRVGEQACPNCTEASVGNRQEDAGNGGLPCAVGRAGGPRDISRGAGRICGMGWGGEGSGGRPRPRPRQRRT